MRLPDQTKIKPTSTGNLPLPLPAAATKATVYPALKSASLLSIGQLCDAGCSALFTKEALKVFNTSNDLILTGYRNPSDGLWDVNVSSLHQPPTTATNPAPNSVNVIMRFDKTKAELAMYYHACLGSPVVSTFINAIKQGYLATWPGLTVNLIKNHLPPSIPTAKGHLRQEYQKLRSTRHNNSPVIIKQEEQDNKPLDLPSEDKGKRVHQCFLTVLTKPEGTSYSDLTGKYPIKSGRGNQYIMVGYDYDTNAILVHPTKTRNAAELRNATMAILNRLEANGHKSNLHIMDNEASDFLKHSLIKNKITYQLVPPHLHRRNMAERAIQTFKAHFISCLCTASSKFPAKEWDRLLPQCETTLNLLRPCRYNPKLSAYAALNGTFNFNATPLAPFGTKCLIHEKPDNRASWATRGTDAWYIGPAMHHYRCVQCYVPATNATRIADTVQYFPETVPFPKMTTETLLRNTAQDLLSILNSSTPAAPCLAIGTSTRDAIQQLATLLHRTVPKPPPVPLLVQRPSASPPASAPRVHTPSHSRLPSTNDTDTIQPPRVQAPPIKPTHDKYPTTRGKQRKRLQVTPEQRPKRIQQPRNASKGPHGFRPVRPRLQPWRASRGRPLTRSTALAQLLTADTAATTYEDHVRAFQANHIYHPLTGKKETYESLRAQNVSRWETSFANEIGRLAQGVGDRMPTGNNNLFFIHKHQVPQGKKITYSNPVCDYRPLKDDPYRVRLTVGGDKLHCNFDVGAPAASLLEAKILFNSVISTPGARFMSADIKDFFLLSEMSEYEYIRIPFKWIPEEIRLQYGLYDKVSSDGYVYCEVRKGMYGLKQAARLAFDRLVTKLAPYGYKPDRYAPGFWTHHTRPTVFSLCVDDFGIKYCSRDDAHHLITAIQSAYKCKVDWSGTNYLGMTLNWNYDKKYVDVSMPNYIKKVLERLQHPKPARPQFSPQDWTKPAYGAKVQYAPSPPPSPLLPAAGIKEVQSTTGLLLYYARAVDYTMLTALQEIASEQAKPTEDTLKKCKRLLDYAATYPNAILRFHASDMILHTDTDAAYLVLPRARSRYAGFYYLSDKMSDYATGTPMPNGAILVECRSLRNVVSSAAEAECGGTFENAQHAIPIAHILNRVFKHPQPPDGTPMVTDNSTSKDLLTHLIKPKKSKTWDMRYHWLEDRIKGKQLQLIWKPGKCNRADYFTKRHPPAYHKLMRPKYLHQ